MIVSSGVPVPTNPQITLRCGHQHDREEIIKSLFFSKAYCPTSYCQKRIRLDGRFSLIEKIRILWNRFPHKPFLLLLGCSGAILVKSLLLHETRLPVCFFKSFCGGVIQLFVSIIRDSNEVDLHPLGKSAMDLGTIALSTGSLLLTLHSLAGGERLGPSSLLLLDAGITTLIVSSQLMMLPKEGASGLKVSDCHRSQKRKFEVFSVYALCALSCALILTAALPLILVGHIEGYGLKEGLTL